MGKYAVKTRPEVPLHRLLERLLGSVEALQNSFLRSFNQEYTPVLENEGTIFDVEKTHR